VGKGVEEVGLADDVGMLTPAVVVVPEESGSSGYETNSA
jgi:hypothetical protein